MARGLAPTNYGSSGFIFMEDNATLETLVVEFLTRATRSRRARRNSAQHDP